MCDPYLERNVTPKGGQANWRPSPGPWGPASLGQTNLHCTEGARPPPEAQPGSPIAPRGPPARLREGNQAPEQTVGPPVHESGGWGHPPPADGRLGRRPPGPMPQLEDGARHGLKSIKITRSLAALGGTAITPTGLRHAPGLLKGGGA